MVKKAAAILLAASLLLTTAVACSEKKEENVANQTTVSTQPTQNTEVDTIQLGDTGGLKLPLTDKPITLNINVSCEYMNRNDSFAVKELEKRTGIKLNIQEWSIATFTDKLNVALASGKLPDILYGPDIKTANNFGTQGAFTPINQSLDQLPSFKALFVDNTENNWMMKSYSADDNNLYLWPVYNEARDVNHGFMYRKDVFDKNGIKEWTTTEEFYQALKKLKELYPESIPYSSKTKEGIFMDWSYGWGLGGIQFPAYFDETDKTWKFVGTQAAYKDMLDFMKKLYNEGLLDPEFLTDTQAGWTAKMTQQDKSFVTFDWIGRMSMFYEQVKSQIADYDLRYGNPIGPVGNIRKLNKVGQYGFCVPNNPNKELALKFLDYATSPSGASLLTMGVEKANYTLDTSGKITYPDFGSKPVTINDLQEKYGVFIMGLYTRVDSQSVYFNYTSSEQEAQDKMLKNNKIETSDPVLQFSKDEQDAINEGNSTLKKAVQEFSVKYIVDKSYGDDQWNEWLNKAQKLGADKYIEAYNKTQKQFDVR